MDNSISDGRQNNGGARDGAGRKPLAGKQALLALKAEIANHGIEEVLDDKEVAKKKRLLILLDRLFEFGSKGNVLAIKEYLDRMLGKSKETLDLNDTTKAEDPLRVLALKMLENGQQTNSEGDSKEPV